MTRIFVYTDSFQKSWKAMGLTDYHLAQLERTLLENPQTGDVIKGTGGARKVRIQFDDTGKRGGGRVIYVDILEKEHLYLLFAYPKNVQTNLTPKQEKLIENLVASLKKE